MTDWKGLLTSAVSALAFAGMQEAAAAQPAAAAEADSAEAIQAFEPAFFARYNPVTAADMVRQLPGFSINNGDSVRGFGGAAGNVLIDGRRPSNKNGVSAELERIAAQDVLRIELIGAAAAGDLDVRGYSEIANVVLRSGDGLQISTTWEGEVEYQENARIGYRVGGTRAWKTDTFGARLNVRAISSPGRNLTTAVESNPSGAVLSRLDQFRQSNFSELLIAGALDWTPTARDTLTFNARITPRLFNVYSARESRSPLGVLQRSATDEVKEKDNVSFDVGGDWERRFDNGAALKLITVNRLSNGRPKQLFQDYENAALMGQTRVNSDNRSGEHVARGLVTLNAWSSHTLEFGAETAFNYRDTSRAIAFNDCDPGCAGFVPIGLPVASTRVEEQRAEAFITDVWRIFPQLTIETGFIWETSTITQTGDASQERAFSYPKPRVIATWTPTDDDQYRFALEREVAQLDFGDFAASVSFIDNNLIAGNPNVRPEQAWKASALWKRQFGERGSFSLTGFYHQVEDVQDYTVLQTSPGVYFTGNGNIGEGQRWGARLELTLPLDQMGVPNAILKFNSTLQDSSVDDPLTGESRMFAGQNNHSWYVDFRQDVPELQLAWGGDYSSRGPSRSWRLSEIRTNDFSEGDLDLFIETTRYFGGAQLRFAVDNIFEAKDEQDREFYLVAADPFAAPRSVATRLEERESSSGREFSITIAGSF